jgi:hypothetical protein
MPQRNFVHHKFRVVASGTKSDVPRWGADAYSRGKNYIISFELVRRIEWVDIYSHVPIYHYFSAAGQRQIFTGLKNSYYQRSLESG